MEHQDPGKRKATQDLSKEVRDSKNRKTDSQSSTRDTKIAQKSDVTNTVVTLWLSGSRPTQVSQEGKDQMKLQKVEEKYLAAEKQIKATKKQLQISKENVALLELYLQRETADKKAVTDKMASTWQLIKSFSQHISYVTDNLDQFKNRTSDLSAMYNDIILKLRSDKVTLENELNKLRSELHTTEEIEQRLELKQLEFNELKKKYGFLEVQAAQERDESRKALDEMEKQNEKAIQQMKMTEKELRNLISELENAVAAKQKKIEQINASQNDKLEEIQKNHELEVAQLRKNVQLVEIQLKELEEKRDEVLKSSTNNEKFIESQEEKISKYEKQLRELMGQLTNTALTLSRTEDQKLAVEQKLSEKTEELAFVMKEKESLDNEVAKLNKKLEQKGKEHLKLSDKFMNTERELQEALKSNKRLQKNHEDEQSNIEETQRQIESLKHELTKVLTEKKAEIKQRELLKEKYEDELKIQSDEKRSIEVKLKKSEEHLTRNITAEKLLKEQLSKLEVELKNCEQKCKNIESMKSSKVMNLEKKLSGLELQMSTSSLPVSTTETPPNTRVYSRKTSKNIQIRKDEILDVPKIKSILKPGTRAKSPKTPSKKITFNSTPEYDFADTDDDPIADYKSDKKFEDLIKQTTQNSPEVPPSTPATPTLEEKLSGTPTKKFFKSRG